jgi:PAS domain-containing protein
MGNVFSTFGPWYIFMAFIGLFFLYAFFYQHRYLNLLRAMLNHLDFPLWIMKENEEIVYFNYAYGRFFDTLSPQEVLRRKSLVSLTGEGTLRKTMIVQGERRIYHFRQKALGGFFITWGMDETQTESLNQELKRHAEAYREVLETLSAGIVIYGPDRRMKFSNHAYEKMFNFDREWLETSPTMGEVLDNLRDRRMLMEQANYSAFRKQEIDMAVSVLNPMEEMQHLPDGRSFRKIMAPHPLGGCFYIFEDVTDALTFERKYNTQIAVQKASLDNLYEGVAVFGSDNRLRLTNPAFEKLWQWRPKHSEQRYHMSELLDYIEHLFDYHGAWEDYKKKLIARVTDRVPKTVRFFLKDGKVITFTYVPLPDGSHLMTYVEHR